MSLQLTLFDLEVNQPVLADDPSEIPLPKVTRFGVNGQRYKYYDLTGRQFGAWTVLRRTVLQMKGRTPHGAWLCVCSCGTEKVMLADALTRGRSTRCGACYGKAQRKPAYSQVWSQIEGRARERGLEVGITRERAFAILEEQQYLCALTGVPIKIAHSHTAHNVGRETTASLDRIDSKLGYVEGNVWWVHKELNIMKHKMSVARFVEVCHLVSKKFPLGGTDSDEGGDGLR
jgi:hypothetical protein